MSEETKDEEEKPKRYGFKHLIECNCILPQYQKMKDPLFHKFPVFSVVDENDKVEEKIVSCNNCGILHNVTEIGTSTLLPKENVSYTRRIEDIRTSMPKDLIAILEQNKCDLATWEEAEFIVENKVYNEGAYIVLSHEEVDEMTIGKFLSFKGPPLLMKVETFHRQNWI